MMPIITTACIIWFVLSCMIWIKPDKHTGFIDLKLNWLFKSAIFALVTIVILLLTVVSLVVYK